MEKKSNKSISVENDKRKEEAERIPFGRIPTQIKVQLHNQEEENDGVKVYEEPR